MPGGASLQDIRVSNSYLINTKMGCRLDRDTRKVYAVHTVRASAKSQMPRIHPATRKQDLAKFQDHFLPERLHLNQESVGINNWCGEINEAEKGSFNKVDTSILCLHYLLWKIQL